MRTLKTLFSWVKKLRLQAIGILVLIILALTQMWFNGVNNRQAFSAMSALVRFQGEYRIADGPWQTIVEGHHIPSTQGDVTLRGNFHMLAPDGEYVGIYTGDTPIAFFTNHINLTFYEGGIETYRLDIEDPMYGDSACGVYWDAYLLTQATEDPIEIKIHNPHRFGNETAIDEMLANIAFWGGIDFERGIMDSGQTQRNIGLLFVIVAFLLLGSALLAVLLHIQNNRIIWLLGVTVMSAGIYLVYSAPGVSFWSEFIAVNTSVLGFSMMFYMLFVSAIITCFLKQTNKIANTVTMVLTVAVGIFFLIPVFTKIPFYDTWCVWAILQSAVNVILMLCLVKEFIPADKKIRIAQGAMVMLVLAFDVDALATAAGWWRGGFLSKYVFLILFAEALFVILRTIPENINAAEKAKELELQRIRLEAELKESRISIMISQIQPHFIYNTLGTIERMCLKDPKKAFNLVRNFSLYLRGNFSELDSVTPIRFMEELKHVEYYANIEKVRFPDMTIEYDVETTDFVLPALSVQPLVENAIKHGLMRLESGGTVLIRSYETPTHYCVEVKDNGVGFDPSLPIDEKKHVGLRNIRERLKVMVNGDLILSSKINVGTKATIMIPKEVIL